MKIISDTTKEFCNLKLKSKKLYNNCEMSNERWMLRTSFNEQCKPNRICIDFERDQAVFWTELKSTKVLTNHCFGLKEIP